MYRYLSVAENISVDSQVFKNYETIDNVNYDIDNMRFQTGVFGLTKAKSGDRTLSGCCLIAFGGGYTNEGMQFLITSKNQIEVRKGYSDGTGFRWNSWVQLI